MAYDVIAFLAGLLIFSLGGNRVGQLNRYRNLMIVMLLGGMWHGSGWNFIIWGGLHGFYLVIHHSWSAVSKRMGFLPRIAHMDSDRHRDNLHRCLLRMGILPLTRPGYLMGNSQRHDGILRS